METQYDFFDYIVSLWHGESCPLPKRLTSLQSTAVPIPGGKGGIGFDDLVYSSELHKVLVPAGHTGKLYLIDPVNFTMTSIGGFSSSADSKRDMMSVFLRQMREKVLFYRDHGRHRTYRG